MRPISRLWFLLRLYVQGVAMVAAALVVIDLIFPPHHVHWRDDGHRILFFMVALPVVMAASYWYNRLRRRDATLPSGGRPGPQGDMKRR